MNQKKYDSLVMKLFLLIKALHTLYIYWCQYIILKDELRGSKGMVLLQRSDSHICEFILSDISPVGCSSIKWKKSDLSVYYKDLEKIFSSRLTVL